MYACRLVPDVHKPVDSGGQDLLEWWTPFQHDIILPEIWARSNL